VSLGLVSIIGRPNVGKSTLFNKITKSNKALVDDQPGVTRDTIFSYAQHDEKEFLLVDTGGFEEGDFCFQPFSTNLVWQQTVASIEQSDILICLFDGKSGLNAHDAELVKIARESEKPVIYAVNKLDTEKLQNNALEFYQLGIDEFVNLSAAHNRGVYELCDLIIENFEKLDRVNDSNSSSNELRRMSIVGRPNVGKSSLLNRLVGTTRSIVSPVSGTTRDPVDTDMNFNNQKYRIVDTAGMRRRTKIHDKLEILSSIRSFQSIKNSDLVVVVIDAQDGFTDQDARLVGFAMQEHKPTMIIINKWDLMVNKTTNLQKEVVKSIRLQLGQYQYIPIYFMSCTNNYRVHQTMQHVEKLWNESSRRVQTAKVNEALLSITNKHTPAMNKSMLKRPRFYYATQFGTMPPRFIIKCNVASLLQESYKKFINKQFKQMLQFQNVPIKLVFRDKKADKVRAEGKVSANHYKR